MGILTDVTNKFDTSSEQKQEISEILDLLVNLTMAKAEQYRHTIEDNLNRARILGKGESTESLRFPISSIKDSRMEYRCVAQNRPNNIIDKIAESISTMIEDNSAHNIISGIAKIIDTALEPILGQSSGTEQYCATTSTFIEGTGIAVNIVRFDCIIWGRSVRAKSIKEKIDVTLACTAYKSIVNVKQLSFDDFRSVYAPIIEASGTTDVMKALKEAREIYDLLDGGSELPKPKTSADINSDYKKLSISDLIYHSNMDCN